MADETEKIEELNAHETDKTELEETGDSRFEDDKIASSGGEQLLPLSQSIESENQAVNDYKRPDDDVQNDDTMNSNALSEKHLPLSHPEESGDETGTKSEDKTKTEADTKDEDELKTESSKTSEDELKTEADTQSENEYITMTDIRSEKLKTDDSLVNPDDINEPPLSISSESSGSNNNIVTGTTDSNSVDFSQTVQNEALDELTKQDSESITKGDSMEIQVTENPEDIKPLQQSNVVETSASDGQDTNEQEIKPAKEGDKKRKENQKKQLNDTVNGLKIKDTKEREVNPKTTKPSRAKPRSGKMVFCKVHLLDGQWYETEVTKNATGKELFDKVCAYLTLQEKEYFGLQYCNNNIKFWLNNEKKILKQVKGGTYNFDFSVKFYPPEPLTLLEDISRFQLCLQVRFDIFNGKLPCSFTTLAILGSYMVQAEVGDYDNVDEKEYGPEDTYMDKVEYAPDRSPDMRSKVYELHKTHKGLLPEESELQYLENAKKLAMYGVDLHQARDSMGVKLMLGVCASGVQVYKDKLRINRFVWPAILKLSYKRNNFYVKKRPLEGEKDGETIGFKLENHKMAKRLWKTCVEHHAFFRLHESDPPKSSNFPGFNSKFRYSGRTQKQVRDDIEKVENHPKFDRSNFKYSSMPQTNHDGYTHGYPDEKDRTDQKTGVTTPSTESGPPPYYQDPDGYNKMESSADKPNSLGDEDRRDRMPGQGDATETLGDGDAAGDAATLEIRGKGKKTKEDKEREKREKEEEKRRKKEEEKERKRLEKEKKLGRGDSAEDRTDKLGGGDATLGYGDGHEPGSAGLDSGKITAPLASDAADARKELGKPPLAETDIDGMYNSSAMGPEGSYSVAPLQSERSGRNKPGVSQETDIDGDYDKYKRDKDGQIIPSGDDKMGGKDDVDDDKKKGDKSKRKESDKSKDKKSGFFGRLRSPRDKDVKKGKGKETDIDSPPSSPVSPDYQKKMTVDEKVIEESNVVKKTEKMDVVDGTSQLASQEIKTEARENVDSMKEVVKDVKNDTSPIITVSTDAEQKIVENNSKNVGVEIHSESAQKASEQNVNGKIDIKVPPVLVSSEKNIEEVNEVSDTVEITKIANDKPEEIVIAKSTEEEIKIEKEVSEIQKNELPVTEQTVDTNIKQNKAIIPDENIEDEVFSAEQKTEIKFKACNHVGSETGSFSSDSSDDESVCGSYHVESPLVQKSGKVKVESIVEEEQSESKKETVVLADMDKQENVSTTETLDEKQIVIESTMDKISEAVTNATNVLETKDTNIINSVEFKETQSTQVESSEKSSPVESTETQITPVESSEKTVSSVVEPVEKVVSNILETTEANVVNNVKSTEESIIDEMKLTETNVENDVKSAEKNVIDEVKSAETIVCNDVKSTETNLSNVVKATETNVSNIVDSAESVTGEVKQEKDSKQSEEANHERNVDEKRDFDIVVSEKKLVSPDGKQIISVRSEKRTETIEKEVLTHTRRELKPEEFAKYEKEIKAADEQLKLQEAAGTKEIESVVQITSVPEEILVTNKSEEKPISEKVEETKDTKIDTKDTKIETTETKIETMDTKTEAKDSNESTEQDIVEVKLVKSDNTLEENVKKMKYIDESSGDGSEKVKDHGEAPEVVTTIVNEEAGKDVEKGAVKLGKKESMRLQKEEKERKKKELNEEKERKKKELLEEKERIKMEKQEEKERVKKQKREEKERKKKEKEAEKERKKMEKENHKSKNKKEDDVQAEIEEVQKVGEENVENEKKNENDEQPDKSNEQVEERVPTAIAMVMAKQKEEEKMEEIDLNDEPVIEEVIKEEPKVEKKRKKSKKDKKEKKEKEVKTPKHKKKTTTCFSFSTVPSSDEEEEPVEEVKEEIVQEEVKPVEEDVKVIPKQKGKGLGWALPGMDELQLKGTKHEEDKKQQSPTSSSPKPSPLTEDNEPRAPLAELTEIQDQSQFDESSETDGKKLTQTTDVEVVKESVSTEVIEKQDSESKVSSELPVTVSEDKITVSDSTELAKEPEIVEKIEEPIQVETAEKIEIVQTTGETESVETKDDIATVETVEDTTPVETKEDTSKVETKDETAVVETKENTENDAKEVTKISEVGHGGDGEMIGRVLPEGEGSIDRRMQFIPVTPPVQETKDSLKHTGDSKMPFFDPASEDTLGKKVPPPVPPKGMRNGYSEDDRLLQDMPPTIPTESFTYENNTDDTPISTKNVPYVKTKTQTVTYEKDGYPYETEDGILISSQSHSTRTQTIETTTYKTEKDGKVETRVEKKVVITDEGDEDENDHDDLLAEAIRSVTEMNPDLSVTRIECMRQIEEVEK